MIDAERGGKPYQDAKMAQYRLLSATSRPRNPVAFRVRCSAFLRTLYYPKAIHSGGPVGGLRHCSSVPRHAGTPMPCEDANRFALVQYHSHTETAQR